MVAEVYNPFRETDYSFNGDMVSFNGQSLLRDEYKVGEIYIPSFYKDHPDRFYAIPVEKFKNGFDVFYLQFTDLDLAKKARDDLIEFSRGG